MLFRIDDAPIEALFAAVDARQNAGGGQDLERAA